MTYVLGQKIQNFDGLGLKIAVLYFLAVSPTIVRTVDFSKKTRPQTFHACAPLSIVLVTLNSSEM